MSLTDELVGLLLSPTDSEEVESQSEDMGRMACESVEPAFWGE